MTVNFLETVIRHGAGNIASLLLDNASYTTVIARETSTPNIILAFLKKSSLLRFSTLVELTAYDEPRRKKRFTLIFFLLSVEYSNRICVKFRVPESGIFNSSLSIYSNAN
jgi:NADH-quinone oxidoreductase subunit C